MKTRSLNLIILFILPVMVIWTLSCQTKKKADKSDPVSADYSGSESCRECHENFYKLWAPSHHGLAMQPITSAFIQDEIKLDQEPVFMENANYKAIVKDTTLLIEETTNDATKTYEVLWALGGKNVYYFLTPWEGGRLQTLPIAYNVNTQKWYNNPESAIRHFSHMQAEDAPEDEALSWKDYQYTFNTSCYGCHVSQLSNNYDLASNTYETHWKEAGINCETCHGPSSEHVRVCREAGTEKAPEDLKIIMTSKFTPEQHNASCAPCHAKMSSITASYMPGDRYFDNFNLTTLENADFYPDGRDLGENYTMTGWHMNECAKNSQIHCVTCHTSSGRYRFKSDDLAEANKACTNCHTEKIADYEKHTHHPISENSPKCIECHMPKTTFGHMVRSDHSFRPPMPEATIKFGSPNACNLCHSEETAEWANKQVKNWGYTNYQKETLYIGSLIREARANNWKRLDEMLEAIQSNKYGEVFTTSLIRLLQNCNDEKKWPTLIQALNLESPLSRSAATTSLLGNNQPAAKKALFKAATDEYRLVRLAAAYSLSLFPEQEFTSEQLSLFKKVNAEYEKSLVSRPDDWSSYYNLGNHYQNQGDISQALTSYENALKVYPDALMPLINGSFLYAVNGQTQKAAHYLERALAIDSLNEAANLNYGLLMAENQQMDKAEKALKNVLVTNHENATAAYNLSIIVSERSINEACRYSKMASEANTEDPKFSYTYAFFLKRNREQALAIDQLNATLKNHPDHLPSVFLLASIYLENGHKGKAIDIYENALKNTAGNQEATYQLTQAIEQINHL